MIGLRRGKNLKDYLVSSRLKSIKDTNPKTINTEKVCRTAWCRYCPLLDKSGKCKSHITRYEYSIPQIFTCKFNNLVYLVTCKKCGMQYVGETKNRIQDRFVQHLRDINLGVAGSKPPPSWKPTSLTRHFNLPSHTAQDVKIQVLELIKFSPQLETTTKLRASREYYWIHQLRTIEPNGMNVMKEKTYKRQ